MSEQIEENLADTINESQKLINNALNLSEDEFESEQLEAIIQKALQPSRTLVSQTRITDFNNYKGDIFGLIKKQEQFYALLNKWDLNVYANLVQDFQNRSLFDLIDLFAYVPQHLFLPNLLDLLATMIETERLNTGSVIGTEINFQAFKRIYVERVQSIVIPYLLYTYHLEKGLLNLKKQAWEILNKYGRTLESFLIMDNIQKSLIRIKKSKEFLTQERLDLSRTVPLNTQLLYLLSDKHHVLYPLYQVFHIKNVLDNSNEEELLKEAYQVDTSNQKTFSQQILTYKASDLSQLVQDRVDSWPSDSNDPTFIDFLTDSLKTVLKTIELETIVFPDLCRELVFSVMEVSKKRNWDNTETISVLLLVFLTNIPLNEHFTLKLAVYTLGREFIAGVVKIKYKIDEAITGMAKGIVNLYIYLQKLSKEDRLITNEDYLTCFEYLFNAIWDTVIDIYPNMMALEKNTNLFKQSLNKEFARQRILKKEQKLAEYAALMT